MQTFTDSAAYVLRFINQTNKSIFLTGKAGTGKTTLLREIIRSTHKNTVVVAPTGIAALNAGGVTIHSMFQLPFAAFIPSGDALPSFSQTVKFENKDSLRRHFRVAGPKQSVIRSMELLVIDEVSMLRPDLLDAVDFMMRSVRKSQQPFGGAQVLYIGDLLQLPPVIKNEEWTVLRKFYSGKFFFHAHAAVQNPPIYIELSKIYRQTDDIFISILNNLRNNTITSGDLQMLNQYVNPQFNLQENPGYITLTTHNAKADVINAKSLDELSGNKMFFAPEIVGEFPEKIYPVEHTLQLKEGAQVMFIKNDISPEKNFFNGKTGIVKSLSEQEIIVSFPGENRTIEVDRYEWKNIRYYVDDNTKEIKEEVLGTFVHYPIKLAWAITVHKSQGLTFEKAALDVSQVFLPGQAYVALSRLRSLEGLILLSPLQMNGISNDADVMQYSMNKAEEEQLDSALQKETLDFVRNYLKASYDWTELAQEWRNHRYSYIPTEKSIKGSSHAWIKKCCALIYSMIEPATKFMSQLDKLFYSGSDLQFIAGRISAANVYFLEPMDNLVSELLWKMEELKRIKKTKNYYSEIASLEALQTAAVIRLLRAQKLISVASCGLEISRETMTSDEIIYYRAEKVSLVKFEFKQSNVTLIDADELETTTITKEKVKKKSTYLETYELWDSKHTVKQIAELRKLTTQTIYNHLAKLIQIKAISIGDVLSAEKIKALQQAFEGYDDDSLNKLKEQYGNAFTWDELKLYKASLSLANTPQELQG